MKHVVLKLARNLTGKQPLAYRSHFSLFKKRRNVKTYQHAALVLGQVAPMADSASLLDVALVPLALVHPAEAGHARNLISHRKRPILAKDLIQDTDVAMMPGALRIWVRKPDTLPEASVCHVQRQNAASLGDLLGEGCGLLLIC